MFRSISAALMLSWASLVLAQGDVYPARPIRVIVPFAAGGAADILVRPVTQRLADVLKKPVVYENRGGGAGIIGADLVAKAAPDGHTLLMGTGGTQTANVVLYRSLPYDPHRAFAPITMLANGPQLLVSRTALPLRNLQDFLLHARDHPGQLNFGSSGTGNAQLQIELLQQMAGIRTTIVPYKGIAPAFTAIMAGEVDVLFATTGVVIGAVRQGRLRALGMSGLNRLPTHPEIPTISEAGVPGYDPGSWYGMLGTAGTARERIDLLHAELVKILKAPEIIALFSENGVFPVGNRPEQFAEIIEGDIAKWVKVARAAGIKPE